MDASDSSFQPSKRPCIRITQTEADQLSKDIRETLTGPGLLGDGPWELTPDLDTLFQIIFAIWICADKPSLMGHVVSNLPARKVALDRILGLPLDQKELFCSSLSETRDKGDWIGFINKWFDVDIVSVSDGNPSDKDSLKYGTRENAAISGWNREYAGTMSDVLWAHIRDFNSSSLGGNYESFCPIIQSSGTGKSRTVDQLSIDHFVIPICLRAWGTTGVPPGDHSILDLLHEYRYYSVDFVDAFLSALFEVTYKKLIELYDNTGIDCQALSADFRHRMTDGQTTTEANQFRRELYEDVVCHTVKVFSTRREVGSQQTTQDSFTAFRRLASFLHGRTVQQGSSSSMADDLYRKHVPHVILAFDEATALMDTRDGRRTIFDPLRQQLRKLGRCSLFTLFLSTRMPVPTPVLPPEKPDSSLRIVKTVLKPYPPFTTLSMDLFAKKGKDASRDDQENEETNADKASCHELSLREVSSERFMARLGRTLWASRFNVETDSPPEDIVNFAGAKLMNEEHFTNMQDTQFTEAQAFACLSKRIPVDFDSSAEEQQVGEHMRVCLNVDPNFETMLTVSHSEPLLSEAAFAIMQNKGFKPESTLLDIMSRNSVNKDDRGELIVLLLLILARDAAICAQNSEMMWRRMNIISSRTISGDPAEWNRVISVSNFVKSLFNNLSLDIAHGIESDFTGANTHFNHFTKVYEQELIHRRYLVRLMARGSGLFNSDSHGSVDAIVPYLTGTHLREDRLGVIQIRMKNVQDESQGSDWDIFDEMEQFKLGILDYEDDALPTIRIVFALANEPNLRARKVDVKSKNGKTYTAYDIWCAGVSSRFVKPISKDAVPCWQALVVASCAWKSRFTKKGECDMYPYFQAMNPGAASDPIFWANFLPLSGDIPVEDVSEEI